jgi:Crinkler effector protein N-terminal domain
MPLALELNCLVLGDDSSHIFTIEIQGTKNISALRKAIKEEKKPIFDHVPADALKLFKVPFPVDDGLDAKLKRFRPEDEGDRRLSSAVERLRDAFDDATDKHLHVIVLAPPASE